VSENIIDNFDDFADYAKGVSPKILMIMVEEFIEHFDVKEAFFMYMVAEIDCFKALTKDVQEALENLERVGNS